MHRALSKCVRNMAVMFCLASAICETGCKDSTNHRASVKEGKVTESLFLVGEPEVAEAIEHAFKDMRYHSMMLERAASSESFSDLRTTNGFFLLATQSVALVTVDRKELPYFPSFHLAVISIATNETKVEVRTVSSRVVAGKTVNFHGGWANRYREISPVREEEEKVLKEIARQLKQDRGRQ